MIYAVNLKTKEHRRDNGIKSDDEVWLMADDDGWVEWESHGQHEPLPDGQLCEIKLSDGEVLRIRDPETWDWTQGGDQWIVAYRPILDADTKPEPSGGGDVTPAASTGLPLRAILRLQAVRHR